MEQDTAQQKTMRVTDVWLTPPGTGSRIRYVLDVLVVLMKHRQIIDEDDAELILRGDIESVRAAAELSPHIGDFNDIEDVSRSLYWVAASAGDRESCNMLVKALSAESVAKSPRRDSITLNHLVVRWINYINVFERKEKKPAGIPPVSTVRRPTHRIRTRKDGVTEVMISHGKLAFSFVANPGRKNDEGRVCTSLEQVKKVLARRREEAERAKEEEERRNSVSDEAIRKSIEMLENEGDEPPVGEEYVRDYNDVEEAYDSLLRDDDLGEAVVVCPAIADSDSREGEELAKRYKNLIGKPLPFCGEFGDPSEFVLDFVDAFPWAEQVAHYLGGQLSLLRAAGNNTFQLPPLLLVGPPGCGKTRMLEWMADRLDARWQTIACGGSFDTGGLAAVARGWANHRPSAPVRAMSELQCANPVLILDELDKASTVGAHNGSIMATLISMMQGSGEYYDSCMLATVNIGHVSFLATANDISSFPEALRDRFVIFRVPRPEAKHFDAILVRVREDEARRLRTRPEMLPWVSAADVEWLRNAFLQSSFSIRALQQAYRLLMGERARQEMEMAQRLN